MSKRKIEDIFDEVKALALRDKRIVYERFGSTLNICGNCEKEFTADIRAFTMCCGCSPDNKNNVVCFSCIPPDGQQCSSCNSTYCGAHKDMLSFQCSNCQAKMCEMKCALTVGNEHLCQCCYKDEDSY